MEQLGRSVLHRAANGERQTAYGTSTSALVRCTAMMWHVLTPTHVLSADSDLSSLPAASTKAASFVSHSHHALQLSVGLDGPLDYEFTAPAPDGDASVEHPRDSENHVMGGRAEALLIGADVTHNVSGRAVHFFCEPESNFGRRVLGLLGASAVKQLPAEPLAALQNLGYLERPATGGPRHRDALRSVLELADTTPPAPPLDERITKILPNLLDEQGRTRPLAELAASVHLSAERLRHLFVQETGLPLRRYALWQRTLAAIAPVANGNQLASVAHHSGFSDQAAFSRSYRRQFGRTPSSFAREAQATRSWLHDTA